MDIIVNSDIDTAYMELQSHKAISCGISFKEYPSVLENVYIQTHVHEHKQINNIYIEGYIYMRIHTYIYKYKCEYLYKECMHGWMNQWIHPMNSFNGFSQWNQSMDSLTGFTD